MKKTNAFILLLIVVLGTSCRALGLETHNHEYVERKLIYLFKETTYPMIDDEDILSVDTIETNQWGGAYVNVTYRYGHDNGVMRFYVDKDGNKVKTKELKKHNGFYRADSWLYTITDKGMVRFHYSFMFIVALTLYFVYKCLTQ